MRISFKGLLLAIMLVLMLMIGAAHANTAVRASNSSESAGMIVRFDPEDPTETPTETPAESPTGTMAATATETPTFTETASPTDTVEASKTATVTETSTPTQTVGASPTQTITASPTITSTPTVTKTSTPAVVTFYSIAAQDGWTLESSETSGIGGKINSSDIIISLGDDASRKQYRAILSFSTGSLPDNALISSAVLKVKQQGILGGGNPVVTFKGFMFDVVTGFFGTASSLHITDFQGASSGAYGPTSSSPINGVYSISLNNGKTFINKLAADAGLTQIRLAFKLDDNNNNVANILNLCSGNATLAADRPKLVVTYYIP